jgi:hypothetical protein
VLRFEDKSVSLSVYTHPLDPENELQTLHAFFEAEVTGRTDEKGVVNYTLIKDNWFVVSGTNFKGFEFTRNCGDTTTTGSLSISPILRQSRRCTNQCCWNFFETLPPKLPGEWDY